MGEATGLPSSALRYYEKAGLIQPHGRVGGRRQYEASVLQRLAAISLLQEVGFTIAEIAELIRRDGDRRQWRAAAEHKLAEINTHLERVAAARQLLTTALECGCSGLESCDLVKERSGPHGKVVQMLPLHMGRMRSQPR